jgi:hypothetical protein
METTNIFNELFIYAEKWKVIKTRSLSENEVKTIETAIVVPGEYGLSVMFLRKEGGINYIPLSKESTLSVGDVVDLLKLKLVTLSKKGEKDILRIEI